MWKRFLICLVMAAVPGLMVPGCGANRSVESPENPDKQPDKEPDPETAPPLPIGGEPK
jgi:hypothetical protein